MEEPYEPTHQTRVNLRHKDWSEAWFQFKRQSEHRTFEKFLESMIKTGLAINKKKYKPLGAKK